MLLRMEELLPEKQDVVSVDDFNDLYDNPKIIAMHLWLLLDANFVKGIDISSKEKEDYLIRRITSTGFDYLDTVRDNKVWKKVMQEIVSVGGSVTLDTAKALAAKFLAEMIGL